MNCPSCASELIAVERHAVEVDWCPQCRGLWFDGGELRLLGQTLGVTGPTPDFSDFSDLPAASSAEKPRRCPRCRGKMDKVAAGEDAARALVDRCPSGDGLWFDKGELGTVLGRFGPVVQFLQETVGKKDTGGPL